MSRDGWLLDPSGQTLNWSGVLNFYGAGAYFGWSEFDAEVITGQVGNITVIKIPPDLEIVRLPTAADYAHRERLSKLAAGAVLIAAEPVRTDRGPRPITARDYPAGSKFVVYDASSSLLILRDDQGQPCMILDQRTRDKLEVKA